MPMSRQIGAAVYICRIEMNVSMGQGMEKFETAGIF